MIQANLLFFLFTIPNLLLAMSGFYDTPLLYEGEDIDLTYSVLIQLITVFVFSVTYIIVVFNRGNRVKGSVEFRLKDGFVCFCNLCSFAGLAVVIVQVSVSVPILNYLSSLLSGNFQEDIRMAFLASSEEGGLPGVIKMFGNLPLGVFLTSRGLYLYGVFSSYDFKKINHVSRTSLLCCAIKVIFSLDRLTILAISITYILPILRTREIKVKVISFLVCLIVLFIGNYISSKRLEGYGLVDFAFLYFKLGLTNLALLISDPNLQIRYGLETYFHFLSFPFPFLYEIFGLSNASYDWVWNPALFFTAYAYLDYKFAWFIPVVVLAFIAGFVDKYKMVNKYFCSFYFVAAYGIVSTVLVPAFRGMEYIIAILFSFFCASCYVCHQGFCLKKTTGESGFKQ